MKLSRWIWRTNTAGAIAIANLGCFGLVALLYRVLFPDGVGHVNQHPPWKLLFADVLPIGMELLAAPVGWFSLAPGSTAPYGMVVLFVPLNAYAWGVLGQTVWRRQIEVQRSRERAIEEAPLACLNPDCSAHFAFYLGRCPACGTQSAKRPVNPQITSERPSFLFIVIAGIVSPMTVGGVLFAAFPFWSTFVWIGGLVAGAGFILSFARSLNCRDRARHARQPTSPTNAAGGSR